MSGELHDEARAELIEAAAYLERQRSGYGDRFIAAFDSARDFVVNHPRDINADELYRELRRR